MGVGKRAFVRPLHDAYELNDGTGSDNVVFFQPLVAFISLREGGRKGGRERERERESQA